MIRQEVLWIVGLGKCRKGETEARAIGRKLVIPPIQGVEETWHASPL